MFDTHPQDQAVDVNDDVTFTCEASGASMIDYTWTFNGNDLMDDSGHIEGVNTNMLMISGVSVADGGVYRCRADYPGGSGTSDPALMYGKELLMMNEND